MKRSHPGPVSVTLDVFALAAPVWLLSALLIVWSGSSLSEFIYPIAGAIGISVVLAFDDVRTDRTVLAHWPFGEGKIASIVRSLGYSASIGLSSVIGIVASTAIMTGFLGIVISGLGAVWFLKHIDFFLGMDG